MEEPLERRAIISGAAQSDVGRRLHRSGLDLTIEASLRAIDDAALGHQRCPRLGNRGRST